METVKIEALKLHPEFYCTKKGACNRMYTCINPTELLYPVCPHLIVKSPGRKLHETIQQEREKEE